jgi:hypothetical protein
MSELAELREQLRGVEQRAATLRQRNAQLEHQLLKPTTTRNRVIVIVAALLLGGTLAYVSASRSGDVRGGWTRASAAEAHQAVLRASDRRLGECSLQLKILENTQVRCQNERTELERTLPHGLPRTDGMRMPCNCQAFDPLCSCL